MSDRFSPIEDRELVKLLASGMDVPAAAKALGRPVDVVRDRVKRYVECGVMKKKKGGQTVDWQAFEQWQKIRKTLGAAVNAFLDEKEQKKGCT